MSLQLWGMLSDVDLGWFIALDPPTVEACIPDGLGAYVTPYVAANLY